MTTAPHVALATYDDWLTPTMAVQEQARLPLTAGSWDKLVTNGRLLTNSVYTFTMNSTDLGAGSAFVTANRLPTAERITN